jgi:cell division protein FtsB
MVDYHSQRLNNRLDSRYDRSNLTLIGLWVCVGGIFIALIVAYAWLRVEILDVNYQMEQLKRDNNQLRQATHALRAEHSSLLSPDTIDRKARQLGLSSPDLKTVRFLESPLPSPDTETVLAEAIHRKKRLHE